MLCIQVKKSSLTLGGYFRHFMGLLKRWVFWESLPWQIFVLEFVHGTLPRLLGPHSKSSSTIRCSLDSRRIFNNDAIDKNTGPDDYEVLFEDKPINEFTSYKPTSNIVFTFLPDNLRESTDDVSTTEDETLLGLRTSWVTRNFQRVDCRLKINNEWMDHKQASAIWQSMHKAR